MPTEREAIRKLLRERPELHTALREAIEEGRLKSTDELPKEGKEFVFVCGSDHGGVEGSKQVKCECGAAVWMSPSTQEVWKERQAFPTRVMCLECAMKYGKETLKT